VVNEVKQTTTDVQPDIQTLKSPEEKAIEETIQEQMDANMARILEVLEPAILDGRITVSEDQRRIIIRIEEKGSIASGSAQLTWEFEGLLLDMAEVLADMPGDLAIEGHTDDVPIRTDRFYSNWDLSAARAAAVANVLLAREQVTPDRIRVTGLADTEPRVPNTSPENRAKNRRVEIVIDLSEPMQEQELRLRELIRSENEAQEAIIGVEPGQDTPSEITW
jgi:chemotaxis protein MotB